MAMNSKNWTDRADKDLFFTILNVKAIGVISGSEWTAIGNQMRGMGYGFTNEGCRQHFQGLRRAQTKAEALAASARRADPTLNPITRRPGPGRGRPRKQPSTTPGANANSATGPVPLQYHHMTGPPAQPQSGIPGAVIPGSIQHALSNPHHHHHLPAPGVHIRPQLPPQQQLQLQPKLQPGPQTPEASRQAAQLHSLQVVQPREPNQQQAAEPAQEPLAVTDQALGANDDEAAKQDDAVHEEPETHLEEEEDDDDDDDSGEPDAKRQRLSPPDPTKGDLNDEAVLALAAHNAADPFQSAFENYGEA